MSQKGNSPVEQLSQQLAMMEAQERAKKRQLWTGLGLLLVVLVIAGFGLRTTFFPEANSSYARLELDTLRAAHLTQLAVSPTQPLVVLREGLPIDTLDDALLLAGYLPAVAHETVATAPIEPEVQTDQPPVSRVEVAGDKKVGTLLTYTIAPFDSTANLVLDFGNGITRQVTRPQIVYRYPLPGHFEMHLIWEQANDSAAILQTLKYQIFPDEIADA